MEKHILGIDIGTHSIKCSVYDLGGNCKSLIIQPISLIYNKNTVEIDINILWGLMEKLIPKCVFEAKIQPESLKAIGVSGTNAIIAIDEKGDVLDNGIMQLDCRSCQEFNYIYSKSRDKIFRISGNYNVPGIFWIPKIMWIKENKRKIYEKTACFFSPNNFIVYKLTGNYTIDISRAQSSMLFNINTKEWSKYLCRMFGISMKKLPTIYESWEIVGFTQEKIAKKIGIKKGIPVIAGCMDTSAAILGLGIFDEKLPSLLMGSLGKIGLCKKKKLFSRDFLNSPFVTKNRWLSMAVVGGIGESIQWIKNCCYPREEEYYNSLNNIRRTWKDRIFKATNKQVDLFYIPNISGKKAPEWESNKTGLFYGLSYNHSREDLLQAILEGISFAYKENINLLDGINDIVFDYLIIGGSRIDEICLELLSTIIGKKIHIPTIYETETLGVSILAMYGAGLIKSFDNLQNSFNPIKKRVEPSCDKCLNEILERKYSIFKRLDDISDIDNIITKNRKE